MFQELKRRLASLLVLLAVVVTVWAPMNVDWVDTGPGDAPQPMINWNGSPGT
jgi:hypothetical protein